jgi:sporulation protein YlmC with PRC-barrel domain
MTQIVRCEVCNRKVGTREDLTLNIKKGCQVDIIITCANCLRPKPKQKPWTDEDAINFLKGGFEWMK